MRLGAPERRLAGERAGAARRPGRGRRACCSPSRPGGSAPRSARPQAQLARAQAQLADLRLGKRPEEIARIEANLAEAKAALTYAEQDLERQARLARRDFAAEARFDQARSAAAGGASARRRDGGRSRHRPPAGARRPDRGCRGRGRRCARPPWRRPHGSSTSARCAHPWPRMVDDRVRDGRRVGRRRRHRGQPAAAGQGQGALLRARAGAGRDPCRPARSTCAATAAPPGMTGTVRFIAPEAEYTPPVIYSVGSREQAGLHGRGLARRRASRCNPGQPVDVRPAMSPVIDARGLVKRFGARTVVDHFTHPGRARPDLRLPRPQRQRQDHDHPHAVRPAHARRRQRHLPRPRHRQGGVGDQAPGRLHDPALQPLRGSEHRGEPRLRRPALRHGPAPRAGGARRSSGWASPTARTSSPARSRAAGSSAWRWPPPSCTSRSCCCSTSPPPASTPRPGASSGTRSTGSPTAA